MCILTTDFQYCIKKRFSLFYEFYSQIKKQIIHMNIEFPKKTILTSGTNFEIVTQRYQLLNAFIRKIFKQAKENKNTYLQSRFLNFIQIHNQHQSRKGRSAIVPSIKYYEDHNLFCVEDTSITLELKKLNDSNIHQNDIISHIEKYILYKNHRLTNDQIKALLVGNGELKGILNISLSINNQIKSLELLRFLLEYISPQKKAYNEKIYKQFQKLPLQAFHFDYQRIKNNFSIIQFKKVFFIILELYCQNKLFNQTKIIQKYPELIKEFQLWKNYYSLSQGHLIRKSSCSTNLNNEGFNLLKKPSSAYQQKAKSFQISTKKGELSIMDNLFPLASAQNLDLLNVQNQKRRKSSFKSNNSTSQLTIQQDWQSCKLKQQLIDHVETSQNMQILKEDQFSILKSNKSNKLIIQINSINHSIKQCQNISKSWNKLIYDERYDQFTQISRIYMKLNGKCRIFKYKNDDQKIYKLDQNFIRIAKKRIVSCNSISKSGKQNIQQSLKHNSSDNFNGFEEIITIQKQIGENINEEVKIEGNGTKVTIQLNFQGEQEYFKSQIMGNSTFLYQTAVKSFN